MLPGIDGFTLLKKIRKNKNMTPIIMITAMNGINDRIDGLDGGADDYLAKPFAVPELMARIRALLRRPRLFDDSNTLFYSDISFNTDTYILSKENNSTSLSKKEGSLLEFFLLHKEIILTREQILDRIWGVTSIVEEGNIDNYIFFLRRRLKSMDCNIVIKNIHGIGYRLEREAND